MNQKPFRKCIVFSLATLAALLMFSLRALAHPYASGVTNDNGTIRFIMNEAGASVDVIFEDSSVNAMGTLPKGAASFSLGAHTSFQIKCTKIGNGTPALISSDTFSNSIWANPRGIAVNKNPKNGNLFGRVYAGSAGTGGFAFGNPGFKPQGLYAFNADQSQISGMSVGTGTNPAASATFTQPIDAVGFAGSAPWRMRVVADDTLVANNSTVAGDAIYQFTPDLSSSVQVLSGVGRTAGQAAGTHGGQFCTPLITGSIAAGNMVLWTADCQLAAPGSAALGPGTSPGDFNCVFRYDIGAGPLPWNSPPNFAYTMGLPGIPGLRTEMTLGNDGKIIAAYGRANGSNPCIQILDPAGTSWLYTGGLTPPANQGPPGVDPWAGANGSGTVNGTYAGARVSPDGRFLASVDLNNGVTLANLTNGIPDEASLVGIVNAPGTGNSRGMDWDAANNLYIASSGQLLVRIYSLGLTTICVTSNDWTGTNGSFKLTLPPVTASVVATTPQASQNYGTPIPGVFRITLNTNSLPTPLTINFTRTGTAAYTNHYSINTNETPNGVIIGTNSVTFPAGVAPSGNWSVDVKITPTPLPVSTNTLTVVLQILGGAANVAGAPAKDTVFIQNTGPQLLLLTASPTTTALFPAATMYRGVTNDYARFVITRLGDTNGPGNSLGNVNPSSMTITQVTYSGTATYPADYTARAQRLDPAGNGAIVPPVDGPTAILIKPGDLAVTCVVGNPVRHTDLSAPPVDKTIVVNLTNAVACPACTNLISQEGSNYLVSAAAATLTELDNAIGPEFVLYRNPLTNAADSVNWTLTFSDVGFGPNPMLPAVFPNYANNNYGGGTNDFDVTFGRDISLDAVPQSQVMAASNWNNVLKMTVNKNNGAQAGVNVYPQGQNFRGNYALRFNMYLSLYQFALNNPNIGTAGREFALFGINHRGTNCNWKQTSPIAAGAGNSLTNSDGQWFAVGAGSGSATPADFDAFVPPPSPNNYGSFADKVSNSALSQNGVFKHPPFEAMNVGSPVVTAPGGGEPGNKWVDVNVEVRQTNINLYINRSQVLASFPLTNGSLATSYTNGNIMLGYLDPNADLADNTAFAYFSNVRVVELSPYILVGPGGTNDVARAFIIPQFASLSFTSTATFATAPITNTWYRGQFTTVQSNGLPTAPLQTNSVNATTMTDTLNWTFNSITDATNYMAVFSDVAGAVTSKVVQVEVILGPTNRFFNAGTTSNLLMVAAGPLGPVTNQWYFNTVSNFGTATKLVNSSHYAGVATNSLFLTNVVSGDAGYYWVACTNVTGFVIPQAAILAVSPPATFSSIVPSGANMLLSFTSSNPSDTTSSYILQSAGAVTNALPTTFTNNPAGIFSGAYPSFQVSVPRTGNTMFYRLVHQ